jgi:pyruvate,orthophosphate dikinase
MKSWVYSFAPKNAEGRATDKNLLGGKGANLCEMCTLDLPVPPGFTLSTEVCALYYANEGRFPLDLSAQVEAALEKVEGLVGRRFGDARNPLLVSVRSGAPVSMPGMMDTVLNLGLNDDTVKGLIAQTNNPRFAYDAYRRFVQMYADVVLGVANHLFEDLIRQRKVDLGVVEDTQLTADDWQKLVGQFKAVVVRETGSPFPDDVDDQLWGAIQAVFKSWHSPRAITYRRLNDISESLGTAVTVQTMVFGNLGDTSATGVLFTRNPSNGANELYGEYLPNAQGEDLVAGLRTPLSITRASGGDTSLEVRHPALHAELARVAKTLESHDRDMQDIEFTIENGKMWLLQTRRGKRTARAALRIAIDLADSGVITPDEAVLRVDAKSLDQLLHPTLDPTAKYTVLTKALPASPGAASGAVVFTADEAEKRSKRGESVILVRDETSPEDIHGMFAAKAILTARGGMTSHAAVVARGMGRPCVCGASALVIDEKNRQLRIGSTTVKEGDILTLNGTAGEVILGAVPMVEPSVSGEFARLMQWADAGRTLAVRANADTPKDAETARRFGAEGVGLCRTEHMFFDPTRIAAVRRMILAQTVDERQRALVELLPMQRADFEAIFKVMGGLPVTIRLLDPPLHEFLPHTDAEIAALAGSLGLSVAAVQQRIRGLREVNPMLGHRGCRLGISYPEIYDMQVRAIFEAAVAVAKAGQPAPTVEVMIPLVGFARELELLRLRTEDVAMQVLAGSGVKVPHTIGTMIELPRACVTADAVAEQADFFSFGTNDLTQTTLGLSRDDSASFLGSYLGRGVFERDPFETLDIDGVGRMISLAVEKGRATKPDLKMGVCGEHGGDPASIAFFHEAGLTYVSCSPYRVPVARLAAAQAALKAKKGKPSLKAAS